MTTLIGPVNARVVSRLRWFVPVLLATLLAVHPARATSVIAPSFTQLVGQSDYIVRARVKSVASEMKTDGANRHILTKVELEVREIISGTPPQPLILVMVGGKVGDEEMVIEGAPRFVVGDEDILFVSGNGRKMNPLVALMHGRYPIMREDSGREYVARSNGAPLHSEQEVSQPMSGRVSVQAARSPNAPMIARSSAPALSPSEFTSRIKAVVNPPARP